MPVVKEERAGTIEMFYDTDTGSIKDSLNGELIEFYSKGANVTFTQYETVTYLRVTLPNGKIVHEGPIKRH